MKKEVDFNIFKAQILEEIKAGKPLFGKDGELAPMIENIVNAVLEGEMDAHLTRKSRESGNRHNGKMQKQVQTPLAILRLQLQETVTPHSIPNSLKREKLCCPRVWQTVLSVCMLLEQALGTSAVSFKRQLAHPYLPIL